MSCNCKNVSNGSDIDMVVDSVMSKKKLGFFEKVRISYLFSEFYFYYVVTSIINFFKNGILEPKIPKRLYRKYNKH